MNVKSFANYFRRAVGNSFQITSEPPGAHVIYIDDPHDESKNITCITPCMIHLPWEPHRHNHKKDQLLIEKDGYTPSVVRFKYGLKTWGKVSVFFAVLLAYYFSSIYPEPIWGVLILALLYSMGSDDIHVVLEKREKETNQ